MVFKNTIKCLLVCLGIATLSLPRAEAEGTYTSCHAHCMQKNSVSDPSQIMTVRWNITGDRIYFALESNFRNDGWMAVGLSEGDSDQMIAGGKGSDIIVGSADPCEVHDYSTKQKSQPVKDSKQDVTLVGCSKTESKTVIEFWRKLDTGDADDRKIESGVKNVLIWAFNKGSGTFTAGGASFTRHEITTRGVFPATDLVTAAAQGICEAPTCNVNDYNSIKQQCYSNSWPPGYLDDGYVSKNEVIEYPAVFTCNICSSTEILNEERKNMLANTLAGVIKVEKEDISVQKITIFEGNLDSGRRSRRSLAQGSILVTFDIVSGESCGISVMEAIDEALSSGAYERELNKIVQKAYPTVEVSVQKQPGVESTINGIASSSFQSSNAICFSNPDKSFTASWTTVGSNVQIRMTGKTNGWVAIGFSNDQKMALTDVYLGTAGNGVSDRWASGRSLPLLDTANGGASDILNSSCTQSGDSLTCTFTRPLITSDANDFDLVTPRYVLWAVGSLSGTTVNIHSSKGFSTDKLNISQGCESGGAIGQALSKSSNKMLVAHGVLMVISWMILIPWGVFMALSRGICGHQFKKSDKDMEFWFKLHVPIQLIGVGLMLISFIIIFVEVGIPTNSYLKNTQTKGLHHRIGITVFALALAQPALAWVRKLGKGASNKRLHCAWHILHGIFGYGSLILAAVAMYLGGTEFDDISRQSMLFKVGYFVFVSLYTVAALAALIASKISIKKGKHKLEKAADVEDPSHKLEHTSMSTTGDDSKTQTVKENNGNTNKLNPGLAIGVFLLLVLCGVLVVTSIAIGSPQSNTGQCFSTGNPGSRRRLSSVEAPNEDFKQCAYMPKWDVKVQETDYRCFPFVFPTKTKNGRTNMYITKFETMKDATSVLHHLILYSLPTDLSSRGFFECGKMPEGAQPIYAWAPGADLAIPDGVGFALPEYAVLQVHYNNPNGITGLSDSSGVLMHVTSDPQKVTQQAGFFLLGLQHSKPGAIVIPPGKEAYGLTNDVAYTVTDKIAGVNFFAAVQHMHLVGRRIWPKVMRNGERLLDSKGVDILGHQDHYDYNIQEFKPVQYIPKAGDKINIHCIYRNTKEQGELHGNPYAINGQTIYGGEDTNQEMCVSFMAYYPYRGGGGHMTGSQLYCDDSTTNTCESKN